MSAPAVDMSRMKKAMVGFKPPTFPKHPPMRELQSALRGVVRSMEIVAQHLRGLTPGRLYGADGALMVPETSLREIAAVADHYLGEIQGSIWRPLQRDADRLLPALGARLREVRTAAIEETHGFLLDVDLMIGTGYAERAGVNFDPVPPVAKAVSPDANLRAPTEAEIALATERSRREDGTVDAFALLLELGDLTDDQQRGSA